MKDEVKAEVVFTTTATGSGVVHATSAAAGDVKPPANSWAPMRREDAERRPGERGEDAGGRRAGDDSGVTRERSFGTGANAIGNSGDGEDEGEGEPVKPPEKANFGLSGKVALHPAVLLPAASCLPAADVTTNAVTCYECCYFCFSGC